jgi:hypothetical protein
MIGPEDRDVWVEEQMAKHLEPALATSRGRITLEQVSMLMMTEKAQVWFAMDGEECISVVVTEITEWVSGRKSLKILLAGGYGSLERAIRPIMEKLEEFANYCICASVMVEGRKGWERALPEGYEFSHCVFEKELL